MYTKKSENEDIGRIFFETLESEIRKVCDMIKYKKEMIFTNDDKRKYEESTHCHICGNSEFTEEDWKVRDHCHTYIHTKLYLFTLAPTTISRLISMGGVKYTINYLQKIRKYKRKIKVRLHYWKT